MWHLWCVTSVPLSIKKALNATGLQYMLRNSWSEVFPPCLWNFCVNCEQWWGSSDGYGVTALYFIFFNIQVPPFYFYVLYKYCCRKALPLSNMTHFFLWMVMQFPHLVIFILLLFYRWHFCTFLVFTLWYSVYLTVYNIYIIMNLSIKNMGRTRPLLNNEMENYKQKKTTNPTQWQWVHSNILCYWQCSGPTVTSNNQYI